jgi:lipopolysaccharide assembly protein A
MRIVTWTIRLVVFVLLLAFGAKNVEPVTLHFYFDLAWQTPLILALFGAFALGAFFGVLSLLGRVVRQRREISALKKRSPPAEAAPPASLPPSFPPAVPPL